MLKILQMIYDKHQRSFTNNQVTQLKKRRQNKGVRLAWRCVAIKEHVPLTAFL